MFASRDLLAVNSVMEKSLEAFQMALRQPFGQQGAVVHNISACLLLKDDNELLSEWIAYHYHTTKMRHLIVAVDPSSITSPAKIFEKWRQHSDLEILTWNDTDYMPESFLRDGFFIKPRRIAKDSNRSRWLRIPQCNKVDCSVTRDDKVRIANHRFRQVSFLSSCFKHHRDNGRTLTIHVDTDEYLVTNPLKRTGELRGMNVPSISEPGSILDYLKNMYDDTYMYGKINLPCMSMPRLLFGAVEDTKSTKAPPGYNPMRFETLRWHFHAAYDDKERNGQPKVIVDVSRVPLDDEMFTKLFSIHRPSKELCRTLPQIKFTDYTRFPITVAHFLGPWGRYNARNDSRRTSDLFQYKSEVHQGPDYFLTPWLQGFIDSIGTEAARILLEGYLSNTTVSVVR